LLPTYDEFLLGYASFDAARKVGADPGQTLQFYATIVYGGLVMGSWRRTFQKGSVVIELAPFAPLDDRAAEAISAAARRYGAFLGKPVVIAQAS
jgi:hypothetical protein